jgi:hypothetical protein
MDDEEEVVVEHQDDALADAADAANSLAVKRVDGRVDGAKNERAEEMDPIDRVSRDLPGQRFEVDNDVGKLGQARPYFFSQSTICSRDQW